MKTRLAILFLCLGAAATLGLSSDQNETNKQQPPAEERDWDAYAQEQTTTLGQVRRYDEAVDRLEARLEQLLGRLYDVMDDDADALLRTNQADWQRYMESKSAWDADVYRGGSLSRVAGLRSVVHEYCRRIDELKQATQARKPK